MTKLTSKQLVACAREATRENLTVHLDAALYLLELALPYVRGGMVRPNPTGFTETANAHVTKALTERIEKTIE